MRDASLMHRCMMDETRVSIEDEEVRVGVLARLRALSVPLAIVVAITALGYGCALTRPDAPSREDVLALRYELLDAELSRAGFDWYEVSNWSRRGGECRHNLGYWDGGEWWGAGPGAHGYLGSTRWWNVKHPNAYAHALGEGLLPVSGFEQLNADALHTEDVMLRLRLRRGLALDELTEPERGRADIPIADSLLVRSGDRLVLTDRGRLLADGVVRSLLDE